MSKFPILNLYRTLFNIGAALVLLAGVVTAWGAATSFTRSFNFGLFVGAFIPFLIGAVGLGFFAEVIKLALTIESHLEQIAQLLARSPSGTQSKASVSSMGKFDPPPQ